MTLMLIHVLEWKNSLNRKEAKIFAPSSSAFELIGGQGCSLSTSQHLDQRQHQSQGVERSYNDLLRFAEDMAVLQHGLVGQSQSTQLLCRGSRAEVLVRARDMLEAMHEVFARISRKNRCPPAAWPSSNATRNRLPANRIVVQAVRQWGETRLPKWAITTLDRSM